MNLNIVSELKNRGLIHNLTKETEFLTILLEKKIKVYCGFDPTADSLHLGHLLPLICMKRFQKNGHKLVFLVGEATSLIGDPSFKEKSRKLNSIFHMEAFSKKIKHQIFNFFKRNKNSSNLTILSNLNWFKKMNLLDFLSNIGKYFSINSMINKESVKKRIKRIDQGIAFSEFSYSLLQAYDFLKLYQQKGVILQIGGSDQWGNISSGINLIRKVTKKKVFGLTIPLLMQSNGLKFGKTERGTIWLDSKKTSAYKFYQFWINVSDNNIYDYLRKFTFLKNSEIDNFEGKKNFEKHVFLAKQKLAENVTTLVHGKEKCESAKRITQSIFFNSIENMKKIDFFQLKQDGIPTVNLLNSDDLQEALVKSGLSSSRGQARNMILANAIYVNHKKEKNIKYKFNCQDKIFGKYTLLRRGKKSYCLICW
ncbi:Tyrosine--tRNA ligase [Buchnera aphidicola (Mindarus abietinus)]